MARGNAVRCVVLAIAALLPGCKEKNTFRPPPPAKVGVATPIKQDFIRYYEATGTTSAVNSIDVYARVAGYLFAVKYTDGQSVKKGDELFVIEPSQYEAKLAQAQAALSGYNANFATNDAEYDRQNQLGTNQFAAKSTVEAARAKRDSSQADILKAKGDLQIAAIQLSYTRVTAPFDGVVSARLASVGDLVGASGTTKLATVVQLDPIYVSFNAGERDVLQIRAALARAGKTDLDLTSVPMEVGLANEQGFPHAGTLNYVAPGVDPTSGTVQVRGIFKNAEKVMLPGMFVRVRVPLRHETNALMVPDAALGSDLGGRYVLVVNKDDVVEQKRVRPGPLVNGLRVIEDGLTADDRVIVSGIQRAAANLKVAPEPATIEPGK